MIIAIGVGVWWWSSQNDTPQPKKSPQPSDGAPSDGTTQPSAPSDDTTQPSAPSDGTPQPSAPNDGTPQPNPFESPVSGTPLQIDTPAGTAPPITIRGYSGQNSTSLSLTYDSFYTGNAYLIANADTQISGNGPDTRITRPVAVVAGANHTISNLQVAGVVNWNQHNNFRFGFYSDQAGTIPLSNILTPQQL